MVVPSLTYHLPFFDRETGLLEEKIWKNFHACSLVRYAVFASSSHCFNFLWISSTIIYTLALMSYLVMSVYFCHSSNVFCVFIWCSLHHPPTIYHFGSGKFGNGCGFQNAPTGILQRGRSDFSHRAKSTISWKTFFSRDDFHHRSKIFFFYFSYFSYSSYSAPSSM